jgi:hypothetical protein
MQVMRVAIHDSKGLIGHADLTASDPPMCAASGPFSPEPTYDPLEHANVIDGEYLGDRTANLRVTSEAHGEIESHSIAILDWPALKEVQLDVVGIIRPSYDALFMDDPDFRAYRTNADG